MHRTHPNKNLSSMIIIISTFYTEERFKLNPKKIK